MSLNNSKHFYYVSWFSAGQESEKGFTRVILAWGLPCGCCQIAPEAGIIVVLEKLGAGQAFSLSALGLCHKLYAGLTWASRMAAGPSMCSSKPDAPASSLHLLLKVT